MASVGSADLLIVPKFNGFTSQVNSALGSASSTASAAGSKLGTATGGGFGKGLTASGAIIGAFSSITSAAMNTISEHVGDAISRFDTLNNYPIVMQNLGYSAKEASSSLEQMDSHLQGLPTAINDMASTVQGLVAVTGDLDKSTKAGLALNDMLLASGSSTQLTSAAMEQFRQILAKGKPDMQDWKSLTSAMPGQMNQLAQAMLGPTATANDLYTALGGGKAKATLSMDQLLDAMIKLDSEGSGSMASFAEQAKTATGGVSTSMANMGTAVTRGIAKVMDAVGKDTFSGLSSGITSAINDVSSAVAGLVSDILPNVKSAVSSLSMFAPAAIATGGAFSLLSSNSRKTASAVGAVSSVFQLLGDNYALGCARGIGKVSSAVQSTGVVVRNVASNAFSKLTSAFESILTPANLASAALVGVTAAVSVGVTLWSTYQKNMENASKATQGVADAVDRAGNLTSFSGTLSDVGENASSTAMSVSELNESLAATVDSMNERSATAENSIAQLNTAQQIIEECAGKTDLNTAAQGRLTWALQTVNDQLGTNITSQDVMAGKYTDADGNVQNLTQSIDDLIEAKKKEIQVNALTEDFTDAYTQQHEALKTYKSELDNYNKALQEHLNTQYSSDAEYQLGAARVEGLKNNVEAAKDSYESWKNQVAELSEELGTASSATAGAITDAVSLVDALSGVDDAVGIMADAGVDMDEFAQKMGEAGIKADDLKNITTADFQALATECGGNVSKMVQAIGVYNGTGIVDKDGNVNINDAKLVDAQGNVYTWNGTTLVDKNGTALVNDTEVIDGTGHVWTWNGTTLSSKSTNAKVDTSSLDSGRGKVSNWNSLKLESKNAFATIQCTLSGAVAAAKSFFHWRTGGIRLHAIGGIRKHADGAIVNNPGAGVPLDWVGEDGAEAIVPLTNKRYSRPFAQTIVEQMREIGGTFGGGGVVYNFAFDGVSVNDTPEMVNITREYLTELHRIGRI